MKVFSFFILAAAFTFPVSALANEDPPPLRPTRITASASPSPGVNYLVEVDPNSRAIKVFCNGKQVVDGSPTEFPEYYAQIEGNIVGASIMIPADSSVSECTNRLSVELYVTGRNFQGVMLATLWSMFFEDGKFRGIGGGVHPGNRFRIIEERDNRDECWFSTVKRDDCFVSGRGMAQ